MVLETGLAFPILCIAYPSVEVASPAERQRVIRGVFVFDVEMHEASEEFIRCWHHAGAHLDACVRNAQVKGPSVFGWLKAEPNPPFLEHLSFRLSNQLFFIRVIDVDNALEVPGNPRGVHTIAASCDGYACLMPMRRQGNDWFPANAGWGLVDGESGAPIDPGALVTDERIEMTDWELQNFAVQIVRDHIDSKLGHRLMSWHDNPAVHPSVWFIGENGPEWVAVRNVRYPEKRAPVPGNFNAIGRQNAHISLLGNFASVAIARSANDHFDFDCGEPALPIWRGHRLWVEFDGLERITLDL